MSRIAESNYILLEATENKNLDYTFQFPLKSAENPDPPKHRIVFKDFQAKISKTEQKELAEAAEGFYKAQFKEDGTRKDDWRPVPYAVVDEFADKKVKGSVVVTDEEGAMHEITEAQILAMMKKGKEPQTEESQEKPKAKGEKK